MGRGQQVRYIGTCNEAVKWGGNTDPRGLLKEGEIYTVERVEEHSWHTKLFLKGITGKFNSVSFKTVQKSA